MYSMVTKCTIHCETKFVGGLLGGEYDVLETIKKYFIDFCKWLLEGLFGVLSPFFVYGCSIVIVASYCMYIATNDNRSISTGLKAFFILLFFLFIRNGVMVLVQ